MHMQAIAGRILSALAILFLLFDSGGKLLVILLVCMVAYMIPIYFGCFIWGGLLLRDSRLRAFIPWMVKS